MPDKEQTRTFGGGIPAGQVIDRILYGLKTSQDFTLQVLQFASYMLENVMPCAIGATRVPMCRSSARRGPLLAEHATDALHY